ncbi:MAG TPA: FecR family protein [Candidatus Dormibacteraeota bacterium]|nr:FecR family protein [Candidatus Dormibacteraeota bacterium]
MLIVLAILILIIAGVLVWLNIAAQAQIDASGSLTVYQPVTSLAHGSGAATPAQSGAAVRAADTVSTDAKGLAGITLPDGTLTRLAKNTSITLDSAHFAKDGSMHDVSLTQQIGRTFTNVQHLVTGASFDVHGRAATASVRGTKFEVLITADGTMTVKVFKGTVILHNGHGSVTIHEGQQASANPDGTLSQPVPIVPDPSDPFGPAIDASNAVSSDTTPGTEQDYIGAPLHDGEQQTYKYSYAGGSSVEASLGYPGSSMKLTLKSPDGVAKSASGKLPFVRRDGAPAGIYTIVVDGVSGLGTAGEEPFVAVASVEQCVSANTEQNGAIHRGYTAQDLVNALQQSGQVSGLSNLRLSLGADSVAGAIITSSGMYNGVGFSGSVVLVAHDGVLDIMPTSGTIFGMSVPAQQLVQQIAATIGQDPSNLDPGFAVDRLFTCNSVLMVDGRAAA